MDVFDKTALSNNPEQVKDHSCYSNVHFYNISTAESVVIVQAGHRGVGTYLGAVENRVLGEGLGHFIIPFAEQVIQLEYAL